MWRFLNGLILCMHADMDENSECLGFDMNRKSHKMNSRLGKSRSGMQEKFEFGSDEKLINDHLRIFAKQMTIKHRQQLKREKNNEHRQPSEYSIKWLTNQLEF